MAFFLDIFHGTMVVKGVVMKVTEKIERRFLLKEIPYDLENQECINIKQGYLNIDPEVRLKKADNEYSLMTRVRNGLVKIDNEQLILEESFNELFKSIKTNIIEKKRYHLNLDDGKLAVLDAYQQNLEGLYIIKVKFDNELDAKEFEIPSWFDDEVTFNNLYKSKNLAVIDFVDVQDKIKKLVLY